MSFAIDRAISSGKSLAKQGQFGAARAALQDVLIRFPANARLRGAMADVLAAEFRLPSQPFTDAHLARLMDVRGRAGVGAALLAAQAFALVNPASPFAQGSAGALALEAGSLDVARQHLNAALRLDPDYAAATVNLARVLVRDGQDTAALDLLRDLRRRKPGYLRGLIALGQALMQRRLFPEAFDVWHDALALDPDSPVTVSGFSGAAAQVGQTDQAIAVLQAHFAAKGGDYGAHINLGNLLLSENRVDDAAAEFTTAIDLDPRKGAGHYNLSRALRFRADDPRLARMRALLDDPGLARVDAMQIGFAYGKALDDIGDHDAAFAAFDRANALRRAQISYDIGADARLTDRIIAKWPRPVTPLPAPDMPPQRQPIFVLGMLRSGTTLAEQILSSHPQVDGGGELDDLTDLLTPLLAQDGPLSQADLVVVRAAYMARLETVPGSAPFVVDKMPFNFRWIGAIRQMFPTAPILHMQRDPMAVCWSIWRTYFTSPAIGFAYDMTELADFHDLYRSLMAHWRAAGPGAMLDVSYQSLTADPEPMIRAMLDHCGLPWDAACLRPQDNRRTVRTASLTQVRRGIYAGSNDQWHAYRAHIGPLLARLDPDA